MGSLLRSVALGGRPFDNAVVADALLLFDAGWAKRRVAVSLIELLVVMLIMGIMMGMLLPALQSARNRADEAVCQNNVYQLTHGLGQFQEAKRRPPLPREWTVGLLPWIEQRPLSDAIKHQSEPSGKYPRPVLMRCPMQEDFSSRVASIGFCHYVLVVDRHENGAMARGWEIQDRPLLSDDVEEPPWYAGPEMSYAQQAGFFAHPAGPHPSGLYMTSSGLRPQ